jgi:signal transduction histidine kinase
VAAQHDALTMRIRTYLLVFAVAILLPMIAFAVVAVVAIDRQQRAAVERGGVETARALMSAIDRELGGSLATLHALAAARSLERDDLAGFADDARRVLASQRHWRAILLITPSGHVVVNTSYPAGAPLPDIVDRESFDAVLRVGRPVVGAILPGPQRQHAFAVRIPVTRDGRLVYVLTAALEPAAIASILEAQQIPGDWVGTVFDARRNIVARTRGTEQYVGRPVSPEFLRLLETGHEGWAVTHTLEGAPVYTPFSRSAVTEWGVGIGIPPRAIDAALRRSLWTIAGGGLALLLASVALSTLVGRRIARPIVALATNAKAFGEHAGAVPSTPRGDLAEADAVARAFDEAGALLRARAAERDAALASAEAARAQAEAASRGKDEFLSVLSHELRTPLNAVYGWVRMLQRDPMDAATRERGLDAIERNAAAQVRLIEELLEISRIVTGKMRLDLQPIELPAVVEAAVESLQSAAQAKDLRVEVAVVRPLPPVTGDRNRLRQVVANLVSNAVKFTPNGGRIRIDLRPVGSRVEIAVTDTGQGITPALLPHVFDRFRQADSSTTRTFGGLGLGLALVRHVVELHGGTVVAKSPGPGQGATFLVTLPAAMS